MCVKYITIMCHRGKHSLPSFSVLRRMKIFIASVHRCLMLEMPSVCMDREFHCITNKYFDNRWRNYNVKYQILCHILMHTFEDAT